MTDTSLYVSLSHQTALERQLEVVANNIANMNTTGFRAERALFDDALRRTGSSDAVSFVIDRATYVDRKQGALVQTGSQLDVAIRGDGWLSVDVDGEVRYTRDGRMAVSQDGVLTTIEGHAVLDEAGAPIQMPQEVVDIAIAKDGVMTIIGDLPADERQIGRIALVQFENEQEMERLGSGLVSMEADALPPQNSVFEQFMIESSNVEPIAEMTKLIDLSRAYQSAARAINDIHDQKKKTVESLGRVS